LLSLDAPTGHIVARHHLADTTAIDGPLLDVARNRAYLLERPASSGAPTLDAFNAETLALEARYALPTNARLGPLDPATGALHVFGQDGATARIAPDAVPSQASPTSPAPAAALTLAPELRDATGLGWDTAHHTLYVVTGSGIVAQEAGTHQTIASLPVSTITAPTAPLLTDSARGMLYLPASHGALLFVRAADFTRPLTAESAVLLAHSALARFLPDTNQDPPFVAPDTFPLVPGMHAQDYWIHFADLGWKLYPNGSAQVAVAPIASGAGYRVTFTTTWYQLFTRTHSWVCDVAPDGSVRLHSEGGDTVP
jgi:hypothetical protein